MKINCLSCGLNVDLDDSYSDYEGMIKCYACDALLEVKISEGNIKSVKFQEQTVRTATISKNKAKA